MSKPDSPAYKAQKRRQKKRRQLRQPEQYKQKKVEARVRKKLGVPSDPALRTPEQLEAVKNEMDRLNGLRAKRQALGSGCPRTKRYRHAVHGKPETCEICSVDISSARACWDHDHELEGLEHTLQFRGWLCDTCNSGIGFLQDSPEILLKAAAYLQKHEAKRAKLLRPVAA